MVIETVEDLQNLVLAGCKDFTQYGHVRSFEHNGMIAFDYKPEAEFEAKWNAFERMSRGLVIDTGTGDVLARPYDKFFNLGQHDQYPTAPIKHVLEKADGPLGIFYRGTDGHLRCNTRGSFNSEQAIKGLELANRVGLGSTIDYGETILAEIVYPDNRIVVDYKGWEGLIVHAARINGSGYYIPLDWVENELKYLGILDHDEIRMVKTYEIDSVEQCVEFANSMKGVESEGFIVVTETDEYFKIKGEDYLRLHRLVTDITINRVWELVKDGLYEEYRKQIPDEFLREFDEFHRQIQNQIMVWVDHTEDIYQNRSEAAKNGTQKDYALWVMEQPKFYHSYLFSLNQGKDISRMFLNNWKKLTK